MKIITRKQAKALGLKRYFTGMPCRHGHISEKYTGCKKCVECNDEWKLQNPEKSKNAATAWRKANREKCCAYSRKWQKAHPDYYRENVQQRQKTNKALYYRKRDTILAEKKIYYIENKSEIRVKQKIRYKKNPQPTIDAASKWQKENPGRVRANRHARKVANGPKYRAYSTAYKKKIKVATPPWLTPEHHVQIEQAYRFAQLKELLTKQPFHVDHIYPIQGKTSCGLHVPWNLRAITAKENMTKHNKLPAEPQSCHQE